MINTGYDKRVGFPETIKELSIDERRKKFLEIMVNKVYELDERELTLDLISQENYKLKREEGGCEEEIREGDIIYVDFHEAYNYECGYMHLAFVLKIQGFKAFIVPMTSNKDTCFEAMMGRKLSLYYLGGKDNLQESAVFLNDARWINLARTVKIIKRNPYGFRKTKEIKSRVIDLIL